MAETSFDSTKPHVNIAVLGHFCHGKTTLVSAITSVLAKQGFAQSKSYDEIDDAPVERERGVKVRTARVEFESAVRYYALVDCPKNDDCVKNLITGAGRMDGAILVVSLADGPRPDTVEQVEIASKVGIPSIAVYLNHADTVSDSDTVGRVESQVRALLTQWGYDGAGSSVVIGSALRALEGATSEIGEESILKLVKVLDESIPTPAVDAEKPFFMPVEDVIAGTDGDILVTGRIYSGSLSVGETVEVIGLRDPIQITAKSMEIFRKNVETVHTGFGVGIQFHCLESDTVERGQVLVKPGSIQASTRFEAVIYLLSGDEDGRHAPIYTGYAPEFYFHSEIKGFVYLPSGLDEAYPGRIIEATVALASPVALEQGQRFSIREGGHTVGAGVVSKVIN